MSHRSLVTGGAGFLGAHVAAELVASGDDVTVLDDLSGGFAANVPTGARLVVGSVQDVDTVDALFARGSFTRVYHLAAYAAEGLSHFIRRFNYANNVLGSINLINASIRSGGLDCFVFTSSIAVYGAGQLPMTESLEPSPEDPYGIAKHAVELDLRAAQKMFGLPYVVFRPHNVYGDGQHIGDRYRNVVGIFMNQALRGEPFSIFGDGEQRRAFTYIGDIAPVIARAPQVPAAHGQAFNVGGDEVSTLNELARVVADAMGVALDVRYLPPRNEVVAAFSNHDLAREVFGQQPATPLAEGIHRMARWAKERGPQEPGVFSGLELVAGLPPAWAAVART